MNRDDRIDQVLQLVLALAAGDLDARLDTQSRSEPLDGVIEGLNMLAEELSTSTTALKRSEESFRSLIERSPDAIFVHRKDTLVYANATALALLGVGTRQARELVGSTMPPLLRADDDTVAGWAHSADQEGSTKREGQLTRCDGTKVDVDVASILVNFDGQPATLSIARDISARKELTARAMEMDRMIAVGTLAAGVGHEINTPLAYVVANLDFALQQLAAQEQSLRAGRSHGSQPLELRQALTDAREGAERVREIVRDLRTFSSTQGKEKVSFELRPVLASSIQMAFNEIRHRARLVRDIREVPMIEGNPSRLGQVFMNLLLNAAHAIPVGCAHEHTIIVRCLCEGKEVRVEVSDTGVGIERDHLARVFDAFFTTKPVGHGTGLGLFVCDRIVREHGGRIEVQSTPGAGTTFSVILPAQSEIAAPPRSTPSVSPAPPSSCRLRVLVVDDEPLMARGLARALGRDHDVFTLTSGREALKCLMESDSFDAVLCDLMMPEMTGVDLYRELEQRKPDVARRVLFFTGGAFTPSTRAFVQRMGERCLEKPVDVAEVRRKLAKLKIRGQDS